jgi:SAM-dependent methyltransferase
VAAAELSEEWRVYRAYHARRYAALRTLAAKLGGSAPRVLDVGPMFEAQILRDGGAHVDTLGFENPAFPPRDGERHLEIDLNDPDGSGNASYDLVVAAEVIEHLHSSPVTVLEYLGTWLRPGGWLVLQTPNATALHKRLRMLLGRNPIEPIRADRSNPGHFHEYTLRELREAAADAGLTVGGWRTANYFGSSRADAALGRVLPPGLRHGITIWLRRAG